MTLYENETILNDSLKSQIYEFKNHIRKYQNSLNNEGVWLFLAALGCWGVPDKGMQNASFVITIIFFFYRVYIQIEDKRSFKKIIVDIEFDIKLSAIADDIKKARFYDLNKVKDKELSWFKTVKSMSVFIISFIFTTISMEMAKAT